MYLADASGRLSVGVKRETGSDDLCEALEALEALDLKPGQHPSRGSSWRMNDESVVEAVRLDFETNFWQRMEMLGKPGSKINQDVDNSSDYDAEMAGDT